MSTPTPQPNQPSGVGEGVSSLPASLLPGSDKEKERAANLDAEYSLDALQSRADAMTPLLSEILVTRPPEHWGLNE